MNPRSRLTGPRQVRWMRAGRKDMIQNGVKVEHRSSRSLDGNSGSCYFKSLLRRNVVSDRLDRSVFVLQPRRSQHAVPHERLSHFFKKLKVKVLRILD
ncbi:hypothetical protein EVAR_77526_1 [Eumeta japonica]|uniref:Uncharacterized protein n=1 Tax=Eumeta variegata TaxID=151549 RepID=A0A4C1T6Q6_EUMVA|nr:hypothetical protein EVAR_77526_1 [Eumeta japonica]